jgi:hypothetical protein
MTEAAARAASVRVAEAPEERVVLTAPGCFHLAAQPSPAQEFAEKDPGRDQGDDAEHEAIVVRRASWLARMPAFEEGPASQS